MDIALGALSPLLLLLFLDSEQNLDINHLIKMPGDSIKLGGDIVAQGGGDFKVVSTDRQVHINLL
jgi:hypothetical protein